MKVSAKQYADLLQVDASGVSRKLKRGENIPFMKKAEKFGYIWYIELKKDFDPALAANEFLKDKQKSKNHKNK